MKAMQLQQVSAITDGSRPLVPVEVPMPPLPNDSLLLRVLACGVCHTELDIIEGRTPPPKLPVIPGHEVVGSVEEIGKNTAGYTIGDQVGVGWIFRSSGGAHENLSPEFCATGRDADGGYAEYMSVPAAYVVPIPASLTATEAAPLLCAGAIGYRALQLCNLDDGDRLGLMGFGASGRLTLQAARYLYPHSEVDVFARDEADQEDAIGMGATWAGGVDERPPSPCQTIIDTTPAWTPVLHALKHLAPGGRLVINAIRKEDGDRAFLGGLDYTEHLWMEKEVKTVANITHHDISQFIPIAAAADIRPSVEVLPLKRANDALCHLKRGGNRNAFVLLPA
ncbi:alcohol dehydrogenase catalytic domain-containing protein [Phycisphaeraceae bacterium D3-23]